MTQTMNSQTMTMPGYHGLHIAPSPSIARRFVAAFRGRKMQGVVVEVPEGFRGVVLGSADAAEGAAGGVGRGRAEPAVPKGAGEKKGGRATRQSTRGKKDEDDASDGGDVTADAGAGRTLRATSKFSAFTLWSADVDVDAGSDEYLRSLSEYQRLSAEVGDVIPGADIGSPRVHTCLCRFTEHALSFTDLPAMHIDRYRPN